MARVAEPLELAPLKAVHYHALAYCRLIEYLLDVISELIDTFLVLLTIFVRLHREQGHKFLRYHAILLSLPVGLELLANFTFEIFDELAVVRRQLAFIVHSAAVLRTLIFLEEAC